MFDDVVALSEKSLTLVQGNWINKLFPLKVTEVGKSKRKFFGFCVSDEASLVAQL